MKVMLFWGGQSNHFDSFYNLKWPTKELKNEYTYPRSSLSLPPRGYSRRNNSIWTWVNWLYDRSFYKDAGIQLIHVYTRCSLSYL